MPCGYLTLATTEVPLPDSLWGVSTSLDPPPGAIEIQSMTHKIGWEKSDEEKGALYEELGPNEQ